MEQRIKEEHLKMVKNFGALNYEPKVFYLLIPYEESFLINEFNNKGSELRKSYESGKALAKYLIDMKIFELAQSGDLKAIEIFNNKI